MNRLEKEQFVRDTFEAERNSETPSEVRDSNRRKIKEILDPHLKNLHYLLFKTGFGSSPSEFDVKKWFDFYLLDSKPVPQPDGYNVFLVGEDGFFVSIAKVEEPPFGVMTLDLKLPWSIFEDDSRRAAAFFWKTALTWAEQMVAIRKNDLDKALQYLNDLQKGVSTDRPLALEIHKANSSL